MVTDSTLTHEPTPSSSPLFSPQKNEFEESGDCGGRRGLEGETARRWTRGKLGEGGWGMISEYFRK